MLIPLIPKDPDRTDFNCRDGEIDFVIPMGSGRSDRWPAGSVTDTDCAYGAAVRMTASHDIAASTYTVRIPLLAGENQKAELMLGGDVSRVDPATAERLTQAMVEKAAETLLDLSTDLRRQGLFILPFRYYTLTQLPDGTLSFPTPQGVALPVDRPPHPEIVAASVTDDCLTLALRFPVKAYRLTVTPSPALAEGCTLRTFISYPLYIPDPKEMRGSIGSVRSATGGQAVGIRFGFLSMSALKASVAAPEKYYEIVGNERTGFRFSSKVAASPDYSCHAAFYGYVPPFPKESLLALGDDVDAATDPMDWIADWVEAVGGNPGDTETTEGYLPASLPHKYWHVDSDDTSGSVQTVWPDGIDGEAVLAEAESMGAAYVLLTRPMCLAADSVSRRHAEATAIRTFRVLGLQPDRGAFAILYGSDDGVCWQPLRRFDPRMDTHVLTPRRLFWRLLLMAASIASMLEIQ